MLDVRIDSIIYQSQIYYRDLVNDLTANKRLGKALDSKWAKADLISSYLEALNLRDNLTDDDDILQLNYILECLIKLCELNIYPVSAPITFQEPPAVLVGIQGPAGPSVTGPRGDTGLATDFQISNVSTNAVPDSFAVSDAKGARWDYTITEAGGNQRSGSVIGTWSADGAAVDYFDNATGDIVGPTSGLEFEIQYAAGDIQLVAIVTSGTWTIVGSRYFIPNNGNGSGPIGDVLENGKVYIGNASNVATAQTISGAITITNTGVATLAAGIVTNLNISASAAIDYSKLAALAINRALISSVAGEVTVSPVTSIELGYVSGVISAIQPQIDLKLTDPMTTIGDLIYRNGSNVTARLGAGASGEVLTIVAGLPTWDAPTIGLLTTIVDIGDWNMQATPSVTIPISVDRAKVRAINVEIRQDDSGGGEYMSFNLEGVPNLSGGWHILNPNAASVPADEISLTRATGGYFDNVGFNQTSWNRGWIVIKHVP